MTQTHVAEVRDTSPVRAAPVARRRDPAGRGGVESILELQGLVGNRAAGGVLLPPGVRSDMELRFGADFGAVRLHRGADAGRVLAGANAEAATVGDSIAVASGWDAESRAGRRVVAHELAHVIQQRRGGDRPSPLSGSAVEVGAERAAAAVDGGAEGPVSVDGASGVGVARQSVSQGRDPASMSVQELEREIAFLEQWLSQQSQSSAEQVAVAAYLDALQRALAARPSSGAGARKPPERSPTSLWVDQALAWVVRQQDDAQAHLSQSMKHMASGLPPELYVLVESAIGVGDALFDTVQSYTMFLVGVLAGTAELVVDTLWGLAKLAWFLFETLAGLLGDAINCALRELGVNAHYAGKSGTEMLTQALASLRQLPSALVAAFEDWIARYEASPPELKAAMIGRLMPELLALLAGGAGAVRLAGRAAQALGRTTLVRVGVLDVMLATARVERPLLAPGPYIMSVGQAPETSALVRSVAAPVSTAPAAAVAPVTTATATAATAAVAPVAAPVATAAPALSNAAAAVAATPAAVSVAQTGLLASEPAVVTPTAPTQSVQSETAETPNVLAANMRRQHAPFSSPAMSARLPALLALMRRASGIVRWTKSAVTPDVDASIGGNMAVSLTSVEDVANDGLVVGRSPEAGGKAQLGSPFSPTTDPVKLPHTHRHAEQELAERFAAAMAGKDPAAWQGKHLWILVEAVPCAQCMNDVLPALSAAFPGLTIEVKSLEGSRILVYRDGVLLNR